jgi:hypothetical protein
LSEQSFEHLNFVSVITGGSKTREANFPPSDIKKKNQAERVQHSEKLGKSVSDLSSNFRNHFTKRKDEGKPIYDDSSIPFILRVDPDEYDIDTLVESFDIEIVSEQEDGYLLVASKDIELKKFTN